MQFEFVFSDKAKLQLAAFEKDPAQKKIFKAVMKTLALMASNIRHPSLNTHEYTKLSHELGKKVFEAYAQNKTPGAYRIFWYYGPEKGMITIISIIPHP